MNNDKIIDLANANIKKAHDDVSQKLLDAKHGKTQDLTYSERTSVFTKDGLVCLYHQNMMMVFSPADAITISEAMMTAGWELNPEEEDEDDNNSDD